MDILNYKKFSSINEKSEWKDVEGQFDVFQLMELLVFIYGKDMFKEISKELDDYDEDYNPDEYYEQIKYVLEEHGILDNFLEHFDDYVIKFEENDPMHWRHKKKIMDDLEKRWRDM